MPQNLEQIGPDFVLIFVKKILNSVLIFFKNRWQRWVCGRKFTRLDGLEFRLRTLHSVGGLSHVCVFCGSKFTHKGYLSQHLRVVHSADGPQTQVLSLRREVRTDQRPDFSSRTVHGVDVVDFPLWRFVSRSSSTCSSGSCRMLAVLVTSCTSTCLSRSCRFFMVLVTSLASTYTYMYSSGGCHVFLVLLSEIFTKKNCV